MTHPILTTKDLAERWGIQPHTLDEWRKLKKGPPYFKLGKGNTSRIRYKLTDVEEFEAKNRVENAPLIERRRATN